MSGAPTHRAELSAAVVVERESAPGSGRFVPDGRVSVVEVDQRSDDVLCTADLSVRLDDAFDALAAQTRYNVDLRLRVRVDDLVLFDGYPTLQTSDRAGLPRVRDAYLITATSVYVRWTQDERAQVFGRYMRTGAIEDGLAADAEHYVGRSAHVAALPCIFNVDDIPNRAAEPLVVTDRQGKSRRIFPFTYEGDAAAKSWSLVDALRYLVWFHYPHGAPVVIDAFLDATDSAVGVDPDARGTFRTPSMLIERLLVAADALNCEATNLAEAVALLADDAGVHVRCVPGDGASQFVVWAPEDGAAKDAPLAWGGRHADGVPRYGVAQLPDADVVTDNRLQVVRLRWDAREVVNASVAVGAVKRWEMTVPLVPGWLPETDLDNVDTPDRDDAKALALTPDAVEFFEEVLETFAWYRQYHRSGSEFAAHRDVARLWVLNEDGAYSDAYERNAPYGTYAPFDFAQVAGATVTTRGAWLRRVRPMQRAITRDVDGSSVGVVVEVSFDSGATWHPPVGSVEVLDDRAGVRFNLANPTAMREADGDWLVQNMWYALIDQTFRVRATAVFDADERVVGRARSGSALTPTVHANTQVIYRTRDYDFASRSDTMNVLVAAYPDGDAGEVDDAALAERDAQRTVSAARGGSIEAELTVPWIERDLMIGDRLTGVRGRDVALNGVLRADAARAADWTIVGRLLTFADGRRATKLRLARRVQ
ncbi:MAG: hypothetical protein H6817_00330 [Phycisphaerales bacterium]|nr:hypothetical protein [Phycisphaerales bacterium]